MGRKRKRVKTSNSTISESTSKRSRNSTSSSVSFLHDKTINSFGDTKSKLYPLGKRLECICQEFPFSPNLLIPVQECDCGGGHSICSVCRGGINEHCCQLLSETETGELDKRSPLKELSDVKEQDEKIVENNYDRVLF